MNQSHRRLRTRTTSFGRPCLDRLEDRRLLSSDPAIDPHAAVVADLQIDDPAVEDGGDDRDAPLAAGVPDLFVTLGDANARALKFSDADGTKVTITHKVGTATVHLTGTDLEEDVGRRDVEVSGQDIRIVSISYAETRLKSKTTIKTSNNGDGAVSLEQVTGDTPVGSLQAGSTILIGAGINMTGTGVIGNLKLGLILNGGDITMPGTGPKNGVKFDFGRVDPGTDISLTSDMNSLKADSWLDGSLSTPRAKKISISGNVSGDWSIPTDGSKDIRIGGSVLSGTWDLGGPSKKIDIRGSLAADVTAASYKKVKIKQNLTGSLIATAEGGTAFKKVDIDGTASGRIASIADMKKVKLGAIEGLEFFVGLPLDWAGGLPGDLDDLVRESKVTKLDVKRDTTGATIAGYMFKKMSIGEIQPTANFDFAAAHVNQARFKVDGERYTLRRDSFFSDAPSRPYINIDQLT
jgi:hypothetical protein